MWPHYYDSERCKLNLWSPVDAREQDVEDVAFSGYAKHQTELDAIVDGICGGPMCGSVDLTAADDFSENDMEYIASQLRDRGYTGRICLEEN